MEKLVPVIVNKVPPKTEPVFGLIPVTVAETLKVRPVVDRARRFDPAYADPKVRLSVSSLPYFEGDVEVTSNV